MMEHLGGIIGAIGGILAIVFGFYQYAFNQRTDYKIEKQREDDQRKHEAEKAKLSDTYAKLYAYLWRLLYSIDADRIFILQPHPLHDRQFISISIEVTHPDRDVVSHKDNFQFRKMSEWAGLIAKIGNEDWMIHRNVSDIKDTKVYSESHRRGVKAMYFRRMLDDEKHWEGTLCVEYTHSNPNEIDFIKGEISKKAMLIADILPEYKPMKNDKE